LDNLRRAVNRLLPHSVRVLHAEEAPAGFHPRIHATSKTYEYRIYREEVCPPFERRWVLHHPYPLDEAAMRAAAPMLEGEHDFTRFAAADEKDALGRSKVRTIFASQLDRTGPLLVYRVRGSGFLKHMVRNIVGTLLEVGKGNLDVDGLKSLLEDPRGVKAGPTAPAAGLFLVTVTTVPSTLAKRTEPTDIRSQPPTGATP
jgi:tRNA pseudouridine38-40 synthase